MDQWKDAFTIALYAKTNVDVEEIRYFSPRPELVLPPPEPLLVGVEAQQQKAPQEARDAEAQKHAETNYAAILKEWKGTSASGLNLAAANQKGKSLLYIMLGQEGQNRFKQRLPHIKVTDLRFGDLWRHLDDVFLIARNITVERVTLFSRTHEDKESIEQLNAALTGLAAECEFGALETQIVRDLFVTKVNAPELQRKFCVELTTPDEVLRQALAWERGVNNQQKLVKFSQGGKGASGLQVTISNKD